MRMLLAEVHEVGDHGLCGVRHPAHNKPPNGPVAVPVVDLAESVTCKDPTHGAPYQPVNTSTLYVIAYSHVLS